MSIDKEEIRRRFKDLFDFALNFIYVHDLKGNFIDANDIALAALGYDREELPNISFINLLDEEQLKVALEITKDLRVKIKECVFDKADGTQFHPKIYISNLVISKFKQIGKKMDGWRSAMIEKKEGFLWEEELMAPKKGKKEEGK